MEHPDALPSSGAVKASSSARVGSRVSSTSPALNAIHKQNVETLNKNSTSISGTAINLMQQLKDIEHDIKADQKGKKEYEDYLEQLNKQKADLQKRIDHNREWIANFEKDQGSGAFETQYKQLLEKIQHIYNGAKEFHGKGIEMLIKEFNYHIMYKRWNDTFTGIPYKPK